MPDFRKIVKERIATLGLTPAAESDLTDELTQHLADQYQELRSAGATEEAAFRAATAELHDLYRMRAELARNQRLPKREPAQAGDQQRGNFVADLWRDVRYTFRTMRKSPLFVVFVVLTLALGIGANTTVFTLIDNLVLNPLPVRNSSGLASVATAEVKSTLKSFTALPVSLANLKDYAAENEVFDSLAGYTSPRTVTLNANGVSQRMFSELVTGNYFLTLGIQPARGRFFLPEEDSTPGAHAVAVMNYATWQARFGGVENIIGKTLRLNNVLFTVVGVAPPRFIGVNAIFGPDLWIPSAMAEQLLPGEMHGALDDRSHAVFMGVGRLKPGVSHRQAQANMA